MGLVLVHIFIQLHIHAFFACLTYFPGHQYALKNKFQLKFAFCAQRITCVTFPEHQYKREPILKADLFSVA